MYSGSTGSSIRSRTSTVEALNSFCHLDGGVVADGGGWQPRAEATAQCPHLFRRHSP
jgi:hypothetical protein